MVARSTDSVNYTPIGSVASGVLTYVDTNVTVSTQYWYQVCAYNAVGDSAYSNVVSVTPGGSSAPSITSASSDGGTVGQAFSYTITASGSPTSFSATPLPAGLSVNSSTGAITGTPTATGASSVTLGATNSTGTGNETLTITIGAPPVITSALSASVNVGTAFNYSIAASNSPTGFSASPLPAGLAVNASTGTISGTPTAAGSTMVTIGASNAYGSGNAILAIAVASVGTAPSITSASSASATVGKAFSYTITASQNPTSFNASMLPSGLSVNTSTGVISGTPTTSGTAMATISAKNSTGTGTGPLTIAVAPAAPSITSPLSVSATAGQSFSYSIAASGNPTSFNATPLPTGLSVNTSTGVISGTPSATGMADITISATNSGGMGSQTLVLTVVAGGSPPSITSSLASSGMVGQTYSYSIAASNGPTSYTATGLPAGFTLNSATGAITGMPTSTGTTNVTIGATNSHGTGTATLAISVAMPQGSAPSISSSLSASASVGQTFSYTIAASGNPTSFSASPLPAGLSVNSSTGAISGTPTSAGTTSVTIGATNGTGTGTATLAIVITVPAEPPTISGMLMVSGSVGRSFFYTISATNAPTSYSASGLPDGLTFNSATGSITGIPTAAGVTSVSISATNSLGTASATLAITVTAAGTQGPTSWLVDLSARAQVQGRTNVLIAGFVTTGNSPKTLLLRGIGPSLANFGIVDFLADPSLSVFDSTGNTINSTSGWSPSMAPMFQLAGAFGLNSGSMDSAVTETLNPGAYTAEIHSLTSNNGVALAEIYDMNPGDPVNRLSNISARAYVGTGANSLIGGFVVGGSGTENLLIRADGPSLGGFGITNFLANPVLTIFDSKNQVVATITGWGPTATVTDGASFDPSAGMNLVAASGDSFASVGAFPLTIGSTDSAVVVTLPAGAYTAQITGANGGTGVALVEIYEIQ